MNPTFEPSQDPSRTSPYSPLESAETRKDRTTHPQPEGGHDTVDRGTNNADFVVGDTSHGDRQNLETGSYEEDQERTGTYTPETHLPIYRPIPGYEILGKLGEGGMGVVYKARDVKLNRVVAIKMILAGSSASETMLQRFQTEAEAVAKLQHPNIVQIHTVGETEGCPYFALEYVAGTNLAAKIAKEPQEPAFAAKMVETLARAMHAAHEAKIIHRDLKPANVLLSTDGVPKIADFGLAKELEVDKGQTNTGAIMGTPSYMSPEQAAAADNIGPATDIYALGAILYDMLTGRPPFAGTTKWNTLEMVLKMEPIPPGTVTTKVPKDLDTICLKCLQKEPAKRYATALELAEDLRRFQEGRPILARPVSSAEKAWRWARRNPVVAGLIALSQILFVAAVILGVTSWILKGRADENAKKAIDAKEEETIQRVRAETNMKALSKREDSLVGTFQFIVLTLEDILRTHPNGRALSERILPRTIEELNKNKVEMLNTAVVERTQAAALQRLGRIYAERNRPADADQLYAKAEEVMRKLLAQDPNEPRNVRGIAAITNERGDMAVRMGKVREADRLYQSALELRQEWAKMPSNVDPTLKPTDAPQSIAESLVLLGKSALRLGDPQKSESRYLEAIAAYKALPDTILNTPKVQRELNGVQEELARIQFKLGKTEEARKAVEAIAKDRLARLKERNIPATRRDAALSLLAVGDHTILSGSDPTTAWAAYLRALPVFSEPLKADPKDYAARRDVAMTHFKLGVAAEKLVTLPALLGTVFTRALAESHFQQSLKYREELAKDGQLDSLSQFDFSIALARCGRIADAEKIVDAFLKQSPTDPQVRWYSANTLAMATGNPADVSRCHNRAITLLEDLVRDGWKDFVAFRTEPTLDALRNDPRYVKFTSVIEATK